MMRTTPIQSSRKPGLRVFLLLAALSVAFSPAALPEQEPLLIERTATDPGSPRVSAVRNGFLPTEPGLRLKLTIDLGSVRVVALSPGEVPVVRYTVHIETDASGPGSSSLLGRYSLVAKGGPSGVQITGALPTEPDRPHEAPAQFWVRFEVAVPQNYSVEVSTGAGDIETSDLDGTVNLSTQGGNIRCGRVGGASRGAASALAAKLETQGGHIFVQDVGGDLEALTGGGHISAGSISGDARLHTGGGHIRVVRISGRADLSTEGGNITVGRAGGVIAVRTVGGQIDFGEVRGSVRAQTGGGGIRITYVAGPMEVETTSGAICLTRVAGSVRAATAGGTITAFINPDAPALNGAVHLAGSSQLSSGLGDIVVYLPRNLAANIEAVVESGGEGKIQADPSLPLKIQAEGGRSGAPVRAVGALNGGGALLRLHTSSGNIQLRYLDSFLALHNDLTREQIKRIKERLQEVQLHALVFAEVEKQLQDAGNKLEEAQKQAQAEAEAESSGWFKTWFAEAEEKLRGGVGEDAASLQRRLVFSPAPVYPKIAVKANIQGFVKLQVRVDRDGRVEVVKALQGEPVLVEAASNAVKQWRYRPRIVGGQAVNVISEVSFNFQLH